jgi:hypothetical protein
MSLFLLSNVISVAECDICHWNSHYHRDHSCQYLRRAIDADLSEMPHNIDDLLKAADAGSQTPHIRGKYKHHNTSISPLFLCYDRLYHFAASITKKQ